MGIRTGFVKVAQSGKTMDGREIKPEWLIEAANNYSKDIYTANIYPEHWEWAHNYGTVEALQYSEDEDGVVSLYADMAPNAFWQSDARFGQRLFTSIAVMPNFAETGEHYLYSMAATNNPASLGVEQLQFSKKTPQALFLEAVEAEEMPKPKANLFSLFNRNKSRETDMPPKTNPELDDLKQQYAALAQKVSELESDAADDNKEDDKQFSALQGEHDELKQKYSTLEDENKTLKQQLADAEKELAEFKTEFTAFKEKFEKVVGEPHEQTDTGRFSANGQEMNPLDSL